MYLKGCTGVWAFCLALCLALIVVATVSAQGFAFKWWQSDRYRSELGLTSDQSRRLEEIFQTTVPTLRAQKTAFDGAEAEFTRLVERGNDAAVMEQVIKVEAARGEINKTRALMLLRMRRALTTDQWVKLGAMHQADSKERRQSQSQSQSQSRGQGK
jgi:Spy/CpxP family protein refolding chaperone